MSSNKEESLPPYPSEPDIEEQRKSQRKVMDAELSRRSNRKSTKSNRIEEQRKSQRNVTDAELSRRSNRNRPLYPYPEEPEIDECVVFEERKVMDAELSRRSNRKSTKSKKKQNWFRKNILLLLTIGSVLIAITLGLICRKFVSDKDKDTITIIGFPGEILMRMFKCIIIPLITASLITGVANTNLKQSTRMAKVAMTYYVSTTILAVITGIILVKVIHPGEPQNKSNATEEQNTDEKPDKVPPTSTMTIIMDLIRNIFPDNLIQATMMQTTTKAKFVNKFDKATEMSMVCGNGTDGFDIIGNRTMNSKEGIYYWTYPNASNNMNLTNGTEFGKCTNGAMHVDNLPPGLVNGMNSLGLIFICIAIGAVLSKLGKRARTMIDFFEILDLVTMRLVKLIMWYVPIGIMSMIMQKILESKDLMETVKSLGMFTLTVMSGLSIHAFISLPLIYFGLTRKNPFPFVRGLIQAVTIAFSTSSSAATLPVTFQCLENNLGIDSRVTRFVLPIGTTINMDGTALYEAVAAIFIGQLNGRDMDIGEVIIISLMATLASVGAAAIPNSGLVTILMVLNAVGLPATDLYMIFAIDWLLDRFRTAINVMGDAYGAGIVQHFCKDHLPPMRQDDDNTLETDEETGYDSSYYSAEDDDDNMLEIAEPKKDGDDDSGSNYSQEDNSQMAV